MASDELIDEHVSEKQCKLAVDALLEHEVKRHAKQQESQLLPGKEQHVWLVITVKQMHPEKKLKPHRIPVAHPIVDPRTSPVCLITKDPQREYKDLLAEKQIRFVSRVVGIEKLKGKFKGYEERRMLLKENDLFLADERVIPLLPGLLGKKWFEAKKQPIPVSLTKKDLKAELERAISSTYFHQNQGTCSSVKIGTLSHPASHVLANIKTALPAVVKAIKGGWDNIQSLHVKTNTSTSLPIWTCDLGADAGGRWNGLTDVQMTEEKEEDESEEEPVVVEKPMKGKGKKRAAEDDDEKPKKKSKASVAAEQPATKATRPSRAKAALPAPVQDTTPAAAPSGKSKKRKDQAVASVPTDSSAPAATAPIAEPSSEPAGKKKERHRKTKAAAAAEQAASSSAPTADAPEPTEPTKAPKKTKKRPAKATDAPAHEDAAAPTPTTPSAPKTHKTRASATDFFSDDEPDHTTVVAPPPNTPAAGVAGKRRKTRQTEQTPVSKAIGKLVEDAAESDNDKAEPALAPAPEKKAKKERKSKKGEVAATVEEPASVPSAEVVEKKTKRKEKKQSAAADATEETVDAPAPTVSAEDVKAKRSVSGAEKKKSKALKSKKSAKDALIGKKGL